MTDLSSTVKALPKYTTDQKLDSFIHKLTALYDLNSITSDDNKIKLLKYAVAEHELIRTVLDEVLLQDDKKDDYNKVCKELIKIVDGDPEVDAGKLTTELFSLKLSDFADLKSYFNQIILLKAKTKNLVDESIFTRSFINGMPKSMANSIILHKPQRITDAYNLANDIYSTKSSYTINNYSNNRINMRPTSNFRGRNSNNRGWNNNNASTSNYNRFNNYPRNQTSVRGNYNYNNAPNHNRVFNGRGRGSNFRGQNSTRFNNNGPYTNGMRNSNIRCFNCNGPHLSRNCNNSRRINEFQIETWLDANNAVNENVNPDACDENNYCNVGIGLGNRSGQGDNGIDKQNINLTSASNRVPGADLVEASEQSVACKDDLVDSFVHEPDSKSLKVYQVNYHQLVRKMVRITLPKRNSYIFWNPILDSGAQRSVISKQIVCKYKIPVNPNINFNVINFDGTKSSKIVGFVENLEIRLRGSDKIVNISPIVLDAPDSNFLGVDALFSAGGGTFSTSYDKLLFNFKEEPNIKTVPITEINKIKAKKKYDIPPGCVKAIEIEPLEDSSVYIVDNIKKVKVNHHAIVEGIVSNEANKVLVLNTSTDRKVCIHKSQNIAVGSSANIEYNPKVSESEKYTSPKPTETKISMNEFSNYINLKIDHVENSDNKKALKNVLLRHASVFDIVHGPVGRYKSSVTINPLGKNFDIKPEKRRAFNPNAWATINKEINKLKENDLVEKCKFPLISPANLVCAKRKGTDKVRLCVDYRRLNEELCHNFFPLPTKEELLSKLGKLGPKATFFKLDISNCFHNFPLEQSDRYLTAFYSENNILQFKVLPFGLKSSPGIVQNLISSIIFSKDINLHPSTAVSVFIDDIIGGSDDEIKNINDLDIILGLIKESGLKIKMEKCEFSRKSVDFMGTTLVGTTDGVKLKTESKNIEALKNISTPKTEKELRTFLGMCNWISSFVPGLHIELGPFHSIVSKLKMNSTLKFRDIWNASYQTLFEAVLSKISNPRTLAVPNYDKPFEIECDASGLGYGAILTQGHTIISYASKALPEVAMRYENIHRETACVLWAVGKFERFFSCSPHETQVFTDNRVTSFIRTSTSNKLKRWRSVLDSYNIKISHKSGVKMLVSDALSRLVKEGSSKVETLDLSDELLEEIVIAAEQIVDKEELSSLELYQLHDKYGHCSAERLSKLVGKTVKVCSKIVSTCYKCNLQKRVKNVKQILGTIPDKMYKNSHWYIDFVFFKGRAFISILDRSTRFFSIIPARNKTHKNLISALHTEFTKLGKPDALSCDRELVSECLTVFSSIKTLHFCHLHVIVHF